MSDNQNLHSEDANLHSEDAALAMTTKKSVLDLNASWNFDASKQYVPKTFIGQVKPTDPQSVPVRKALMHPQLGDANLQKTQMKTKTFDSKEKYLLELLRKQTICTNAMQQGKSDVCQTVQKETDELVKLHPQYQQEVVHVLQQPLVAEPSADVTPVDDACKILDLCEPEDSLFFLNPDVHDSLMYI